MEAKDFKTCLWWVVSRVDLESQRDWWGCKLTDLISRLVVKEWDVKSFPTYFQIQFALLYKVRNLLSFQSRMCRLAGLLPGKFNIAFRFILRQFVQIASLFLLALPHLLGRVRCKQTLLRRFRQQAVGDQRYISEGWQAFEPDQCITESCQCVVRVSDKQFTKGKLTENFFGQATIVN